MKPPRSILTSIAGILGSLVCLSTFCRAMAADGPADERALWKERCEKVTVGMTRAEVEKILPLLRFTTSVTMRTGSRQAIRYYVSPGWCVVITYDYTGVPRDASGTATSHTSPENKVLAPVTLEHRTEPAVKPAPKKAP